MPHLRLTDLAISKLQHSNTQITYWDTALPIGFGVRVGARRKTFILVDTEGRRLKLGVYPHCSLADARRLALEARHSPQAALRATQTKDCISEYLKHHQGTPAWVRKIEHQLNRHLAPHLETPIDRITTQHILTITDSLADRPSQRLHVHRNLVSFFKWLTSRRAISASPVTGLRAPVKERTRSHVLSYADLKAIWSATDQLGDFGLVVKLCILTGQRRGEIAQIQPSWITPGLLTIPASATKNGREHAIPLTPLMQSLVDQAPFRISSWSRSKAELDGLSLPGWKLHDARRTLCTHCAELGVTSDIIERICNRVTGTPVSRIYNRHEYLPSIRTALAQYQNELEKRGVIT